LSTLKNVTATVEEIIKIWSLSQNSVSFGKGFRKSSLKPAFSIKSKVAFPKTEVLGKPQIIKKRTGYYEK